jgi:hypothetical protein
VWPVVLFFERQFRVLPGTWFGSLLCNGQPLLTSSVFSALATPPFLKSFVKESTGKEKGIKLCGYPQLGLFYKIKITIAYQKYYKSIKNILCIT